MFAPQNPLGLSFCVGISSTKPVRDFSYDPKLEDHPQLTTSDTNGNLDASESQNSMVAMEIAQIKVDEDFPLLNTTREYPGVSNVNGLRYVELKVPDVQSKQCWLKSLQVFDKINYQPMELPVVDEDVVITALDMRCIFPIPFLRLSS